MFPSAPPHASTKDYAHDWEAHLDPLGPIGLLVESVAWNGLAIDKHLNIWQHAEQPVGILTMPHHDLKKQLHIKGLQPNIIARRVSRDPNDRKSLDIYDAKDVYGNISTFPHTRSLNSIDTDYDHRHGRRFI
mgnify:CR=1 FL=1